MIFYKLLSLNGNKAPAWPSCSASSFPEIMHYLRNQIFIFINKTVIELWFITRPLEESQHHTFI